MKKIKDMSISELIDALNDQGYSNSRIESAFDLEHRILRKCHKDNKCTPVMLSLLRSLVSFPWMIRVSESGFDEKFAEAMLMHHAKYLANVILLEKMREA